MDRVNLMYVLTLGSIVTDLLGVQGKHMITECLTIHMTTIGWSVCLAGGEVVCGSKNA